MKVFFHYKVEMCVDGEEKGTLEVEKFSINRKEDGNFREGTDCM